MDRRCPKCEKVKKEKDFYVSKERLRSHCKSCEDKYDAEYAKKNKEKIKAYRRAYYLKNREKALKKAKEYREINGNSYNKLYFREYFKNRRANDPLFRFSSNLRTLVKNSLRKRKYKTGSTSEEILGFSYLEVWEHLKQSFENNYNLKWDDAYLEDIHIDHIQPLASAETKEELIKLCHYDNLQLLWARDNRAKGAKLCITK